MGDGEVFLGKFVRTNESFAAVARTLILALLLPNVLMLLCCVSHPFQLAIIYFIFLFQHVIVTLSDPLVKHAIAKLASVIAKRE